MNGGADLARLPLPRFWIGLALLSWGGFTANISGALVMALLLEIIGLLTTRWAMEDKEFHRAADLSSLVLVAITMLQFSRFGVHGIYEILKAAPYCFFPIMIAQRASTAQTIPMSAMFYGLRKEKNFHERMDFSPFFIAVCVLAGTTTDQRGVYFALLSSVIIIGLLAVARPRRYHWGGWVAAIVFAVAFGLAVQLGFLYTHRLLERSLMYWITQFAGQTTDPKRAITAIGSIGLLKFSDQIRLRVFPTSELRLPLLLQEASYDTFDYGTWTAEQAEFDVLARDNDQDEWITAPESGVKTTAIDISISHQQDLVVLPIPRGTRRVTGPEIVDMQVNRFGALIAESPEGALSYQVLASPELGTEPAPRDSDLSIPVNYGDLFARLEREIGLQGLDKRAAVSRIRRFFLDNFSYTLMQRASLYARTPLADFLLRHRSGHCEYFATASTLLLRQAGIPSRYAVGFAVDEFNTLEGAYVARARHAHSWSLAYLDGKWIVVDVTPSAWLALEEESASKWQSLQDLLSWVWYRYQRFMQLDFSAYADLAIWLIPPLALLLFFRLRRSPSAVRIEPVNVAGRLHEATDSPLLELLRNLEARNLRPDKGETLSRFLLRVAPESSAGISRSELLRRYYRLRFAPRSDNPPDTEALRELADNYTRELPSS